MKTHFTRKNFIAIAMVFFFLLFAVIAALACDATNPVFVAGNPIQKIGLAFGFPSINGSSGAWILFICVVIYILLFAAAFIFEMRLAIYYDNRVWTKKWTLVYAVTFLILAGLAIGIGTVSQYPYNPSSITNSFLFLAEGLVVGFVLYVVCVFFIGGIVMLYVNFKNIDKPFRFFKRNNEDDLKREEEQDKLDELEQEEQGKLAESFGENSNSTKVNANQTGAVGGVAANGTASGNPVDSSSPLKEKERVFPGLCSIDYVEQAFRDGTFEDDISLKEFCSRFRNYLAKEEGLFYSESTIRSFVAGLSASRLIILEGLSGTGKSSLARYFSDFIGEDSYFEAVQATWRDKTSLLGYYNDFSKTYNETEFLKRLYQFTFRENHVNVMVLDEMNISRIEYYFADFLSVLEYPTEKWKLKIMQLPYDFDAPLHLPDGVLNIPSNTWFIGTANKDDSTYTITDKVYDRAITISFSNRNESFEVKDEVKKAAISYQGLMNLFAKAQNDKKNHLSSDDLAKFKILNDFTYKTFDITFGNRINHQIALFIPTFVASGGKKEEALDFIFARKVVSKLQGRFEDYVRQGLIDLKSLINKVYGEETFIETKELIERLLRRM